MSHNWLHSAGQGVEAKMGAAGAKMQAALGNAGHWFNQRVTDVKNAPGVVRDFVGDTIGMAGKGAGDLLENVLGGAGRGLQGVTSGVSGGLVKGLMPVILIVGGVVVLFIVMNKGNFGAKVR